MLFYREVLAPPVQESGVAMSVTDERWIARAQWFANPVDLHYRGELIELGVRVTAAIEEEVVRNAEINDKLTWG